LKGEAGEADVAANAWLRGPTIIEEYSPDDIFNADETGLYYRALPEHTHIFKKDNANIKENLQGDLVASDFSLFRVSFNLVASDS